jgi:hypothetical protein
MESSDDHVTLPDGTTLPASPDNRSRARQLWATDNSSSDKVNNEMNAEEQRVLVLEEHLRAQREEFERALESEQAQRAQEHEQHEQELRAQEQEHQDQRARAQAYEQERERERQREFEKLQMQLQYEQRLSAVQDRLQQEMERNEHNQPVRVTDTDVHAAAERERTRLQAILYSLPMNHPAFDPVVELSNCILLPSGLMQEHKTGSTSTTTPAELFDKICEKSPDVVSILSKMVAGSSLKSALQKFRSAFYSKKKPQPLIMMVSMTQAITDFLPDLRNKAAAALKLAVSLVHCDRLKAIEKVKKTGELPTVQAGVLQMKLPETPGMIELLSADDSDLFSGSIEELIMAFVSFERNVPQKLTQAETDWCTMDGSAYVDCEDLINDDQVAFGICSSWFGSDICPAYHHFTHLVSISPEEVKCAYADMISSPYSGETELTMMQKQDWDKYLVVFRKIWNTAQSRMNASSQLNLSSGNQNWADRVKPGADQIQRARPQSQRFTQPQQLTRQDTRSDLPRSDLQDKVLQCVNCGSDFNFSVSSQNHHIEKGWQTLPSKGPCCRDWEQLKCSLFDQFGDCRFGTACRYSHNKPQSSSDDSNNKENSFADKPPGSIQSVCNRLPDCSFGDRCVFRHPGRELNQQSEASALEKEKAQKSELDNFRGIPIKKERGVRFNQ